MPFSPALGCCPGTVSAPSTGSPLAVSPGREAAPRGSAPAGPGAALRPSHRGPRALPSTGHPSCPPAGCSPWVPPGPQASCRHAAQPRADGSVWMFLLKNKQSLSLEASRSSSTRRCRRRGALPAAPYLGVGGASDERGSHSRIWSYLGRSLKSLVPLTRMLCPMVPLGSSACAQPS